jgi:hypothetical protein
MSAGGRTELLEFLEYLAKKGLMNPTTARSRKAAASGVLGILTDDEAADISNIDLNEVMRRFSNLNGTKFTPDSLATYKSRTKSAIDDFLRYKENPLAFRAATPTGSRAARTKPALQTESERKPTSSEVSAAPVKPEPVSRPLAVDNIVPIQVRADLTVYVQGLPFDLSQIEARKIANVILAMAMPVE